jgi:hypothetical protein
MRLPIILLLLGSAACSGAFVAAGPSLDMGTLAVSGLHGGVGRHLELGKLCKKEPTALGVALTGAIAGYSSAGGLVAHLALGFQGGRRSLPWWVALRARPAELVGDDQAEFFGSMQLSFGRSLRRD